MGTRHQDHDPLIPGPGQKVEYHTRHYYDHWQGVPDEYKGNGWVMINHTTYANANYTDYCFQRLVEAPQTINNGGHTVTNNKVEITPYEPQQHTELVARIRAIEELRSSEVFIKGIHYGEPYKNAGKDVLLKAGAETIMSRFHLWPEFIERSIVEKWDRDNPLFHYRYECRLIHRESGLVWGGGIGSCNSLEDKYGWRWVSEIDVPLGTDKATLETRGGAISEFAFAVDKAETTGQYGKPEAHWQAFKTAIQNGTARAIRKTSRAGKEMDAWEIGAPEYRIPNTNVFTLVNTIDKMAQKRALVAAVLIATGASAYFTQDVEDFPEYSGVIYDGETITPIVEPPAQPKAAPKAQPAPAPQEPPAPKPSELDEYFPRDGEPANGHDAARETPPAASTNGTYDPRADDTTLSSLSWEKAAQWIVSNDPRVTCVAQASGDLKLGLQEAGVLAADLSAKATWPTIYGKKLTIAQGVAYALAHLNTKYGALQPAQV